MERRTSLRATLLVALLSLAGGARAGVPGECEPILRALAQFEVGKSQLLATFSARNGTPLELRVRPERVRYEFFVWSTGENASPVGFAKVVERRAGGQLFLEEVRVDDGWQKEGVGSAILTYLHQESAPGTTLRLRSTNVETNNTLTEVDTALFGTKPPAGKNAAERRNARNAALTAEVRRLLAEGPREKIPLWARTLNNAGWQDVTVEVTSGGDVYLEAKKR